MIRSMVMVSLLGPMVECIKGYGKMENSMEKENILLHNKILKKVFGIREKESDG